MEVFYSFFLFFFLNRDLEFEIMRMVYLWWIFPCLLRFGFFWDVFGYL